ncbi:glycosyltransferase [uncultured Polaribacter sp.]|uniref:glycosyltransferase family 2 protein n=1 Tax=uncultured Polaribacter sp. TaxID=174711 RepID=UPI002633890B|nr:glycosyltransferase [uncultured Polaribacter sp.]
MNLKKYTTKSSEVILYTGNPDFDKLEKLVQGAGDVWHSSLDQGFKNCFKDLKYYAAIYWWFINDFDNLEESISWRINIDAFAIREKVWNQLSGFDLDYESKYTTGLDLGFNTLMNSKGVILYIKGLYKEENNKVLISRNDRYIFYIKNFVKNHTFYMLFRKGLFNIISEYSTFYKASKKFTKKKTNIITPRELNPIKGNPTVSLIIPTMKRQKFTQLLLEDHKNQTYLIKEAVIVDATPESERDSAYYQPKDFPFDIIVKWQETKGSCKARNEAIDLCTGDYIIFADDDIRILPDFVENHIKLLQTYNADASNGLDITAKNIDQDLGDLKFRLAQMAETRWRVGVSPIFSNANSCVKRNMVDKLIGNDINFDGGYGEDADFGISIIKKGGILLQNPFSPNLHLKPAEGGYRWWGLEARKMGKKRKQQPWELDNPVKNLRPVPSPTITYGVLKHFTKDQIKEWRSKHFFIYLFKKDLKTLPLRLLKLPYKQIQFSKSLKYARALINLGPRYK